MGDWIEKICAKPIAFWIFSVLFIIGSWKSIDIANISISYFTAALLLLTVGSARRSEKAMHVKLDAIIHALDKADDEIAQVEELTEAEIEERREHGR
jgi:low affinity Fe/Cu permease